MPPKRRTSPNKRPPRCPPTTRKAMRERNTELEKVKAEDLNIIEHLFMQLSEQEILMALTHSCESPEGKNQYLNTQLHSTAEQVILLKHAYGDLEKVNDRLSTELDQTKKQLHDDKTEQEKNIDRFLLLKHTGGDLEKVNDCLTAELEQTNKQQLHDDRTAMQLRMSVIRLDLLKKELSPN